VGVLHWIVISGMALGLNACQLVSRNPRSVPPEPSADPAAATLLNIVEKEILPSLKVGRSALTALDVLNSSDSNYALLSEMIFDLERSFKASAVPEIEGTRNGTDSPFAKFYMPFMIENNNHTLMANITRDRGAKNRVFDIFALATDKEGAASKVMPILSRLKDGSIEDNRSFWFFDMKALGLFFDAMRGPDAKPSDPDLSVQFYTTSAVQDLTVESPTFKKGVSGISWKRFKALSTLDASDPIRIKITVKCGAREMDLDFDIARNLVESKNFDVIKSTLMTKVDPRCLEI
jgi:hypothetical protein